MARDLPRKQASFRLDADLVEDLLDTAKRTNRKPRQVVELALQRILPLVESGYLDSPDGSQLFAMMDDLEKEVDKEIKAFKAKILQEEGLSPSLIDDVKPEARALTVFRLNNDLLARIRAVAEKTGRNDRQVVELCLRRGIPLTESWVLLEPHFERLKAAWGELRQAIQLAAEKGDSDEEVKTRLDVANKNLVKALYGAVGSLMPKRNLPTLPPSEPEKN